MAYYYFSSRLDGWIAASLTCKHLKTTQLSYLYVFLIYHTSSHRRHFSFSFL